MIRAIVVLCYVLAGGIGIGACMFLLALAAELLDPDQDGRAPADPATADRIARSAWGTTRGPDVAYDAARHEMQARLKTLQARTRR
jgi:hypothetical protein